MNRKSGKLANLRGTGPQMRIKWNGHKSGLENIHAWAMQGTSKRSIEFASRSHYTNAYKYNSSHYLTLRMSSQPPTCPHLIQGSWTWMFWGHRAKHLVDQEPPTIVQNELMPPLPIPCPWADTSVGVLKKATANIQIRAIGLSSPDDDDEDHSSQSQSVEARKNDKDLWNIICVH